MHAKRYLMAEPVLKGRQDGSPRVRGRNPKPRAWDPLIKHLKLKHLTAHGYITSNILALLP